MICRQITCSGGHLVNSKKVSNTSVQKIVIVNNCFLLNNYILTYKTTNVDSKGKMKTIQQNGKVSVKTENPDDENDDDEDDKSSLSNLKYEDPGTFIIDKDEEMTAESEVQYKQIHGLACALLQIAQAIEVKYFKPPYGNLKSGGKYGTKEENAEKAQRSLERWQVSLMNSQNASQLFLHYNVLYDAIKWTRSAQNAKCSCRSSKDPDKLLLCDGCNIGRHIYCLKPKLTVSKMSCFNGIPIFNSHRKYSIAESA